MAECPSGLHHRKFRGQWLPPVKYSRALAGLVKLLDAGNAPRQPGSPVTLCGFPGRRFVCFYLFRSKKIFVKSSGNTNGFTATVPGTRLRLASRRIAAGALSVPSRASCGCPVPSDGVTAPWPYAAAVPVPCED